MQAGHTMHAFLITGGTKDARLHKVEEYLRHWHISVYDSVIIDRLDEHIRIEDIRDIQKRLYLRPVNSKYSVLIIIKAENLTHEAQGALLKLLEEPPEHSRILCETGNTSLLLPTVISRCQLVDVGICEEISDEDTSGISLLIQASGLPPGKRLTLVDNIAKSRDEALTWVQHATGQARGELLRMYREDSQKKQPEKRREHQWTVILRSLMRARVKLGANVHPGLALDELFLTI